MKNILRTMSFLVYSIAVLESPMLEATEMSTPDGASGISGIDASDIRRSLDLSCGRIASLKAIFDPSKVNVEELDEKVEELNLSHNELTSLAGLPDLKNLRELDLYENKLTSLNELFELSLP